MVEIYMTVLAMTESEKSLASPIISSSSHPHKAQLININLNASCLRCKYSFPSNQMATPKPLQYRNFGDAI